MLELGKINAVIIKNAAETLLKITHNTWLLLYVRSKTKIKI